MALDPLQARLDQRRASGGHELLDKAPWRSAVELRAGVTCARPLWHSKAPDDRPVNTRPKQHRLAAPESYAKEEVAAA